MPCQLGVLKCEIGRRHHGWCPSKHSTNSSHISKARPNTAPSISTGGASEHPHPLGAPFRCVPARTRLSHAFPRAAPASPPPSSRRPRRASEPPRSTRFVPTQSIVQSLTRIALHHLPLLSVAEHKRCRPSYAQENAIQAVSWFFFGDLYVAFRASKPHRQNARRHRLLSHVTRRAAAFEYSFVDVRNARGGREVGG